MNAIIVMIGLAWAEPAAEDTGLEDTSAEDTAIEDTSTEDTANIEDTASLDDTFSSDTSDSGSQDTGNTDSGSNTDTSTTDSFSDTSDIVIPASSLAGEKGGYGCASVGVGGVLVIWIASFAIGFRREPGHY